MIKTVCFIAAMMFAGQHGFCKIGSGTDLQNSFISIASAAHGNVGVAVELLETKEGVQLNGTNHFPMQSVYKLPIGMAVLQQIDRGTLALGQMVVVTTNDFVSKKQHSPLRDQHPFGTELSVSNLLQKMISESDGSACDVCLRLLKGPPAVDQYLKNLGATDIAIATTEKEMGQNESVQYQNWATPQGFTALLEMVYEGRGLSSTNREMLLRLMTETETGLHRIKGMLPAHTPVAHKTGSSVTVGALTRATNDAGIVTLPDGRHLAVTVFISDSTADEAAREAVIAKIARTAWDHFTEKAH